MSRELQTSFQGTGATLYVLARLESTGTVWNVTNAALETYSAASLASYAIDLTDEGGDLYSGDIPTDLPSGTYRFFYYEQAGGSPATTDLILKSPVRAWNGTVLADPADPTDLATYALTTPASVKRRLGMEGDASADVLLTELINQVSLEIERVTGRQFAARDYREWLNGANQRELVLPHFPVQQMTRIAWGAAQAMSVSYNGAGIRANASVYKSPESADAGGLRLVTVSTAGVKTATNLSFATYGSVTALATAVNLISGWSATTVTNVPTGDLVPSGGEDARGRSVFFNYPDVDEYAYSVDYERGLVQFDRYGSGAWPFACHGQGVGVSGWREPAAMPRGFQHVLVEWRAGYETIPADVQGVANYLVADAYFDAQLGKGVTEVKLGPGVLKLDKGMDRDIARDLGHYIDLSRFIGGAR